MNAATDLLINTPEIELWPAARVNARSNTHARVIAFAECVLRRKCDGRFLAALGARGLQPLAPQLSREPGLEWALEAWQARARGHVTDSHNTLPARALEEHNRDMGLPADYASQSGLPFHLEPTHLQLAGKDRYGRALWLLRPAACAWRAMQCAALRDGVVLQAISGYRSHAYQRGIFERKFARGLSLEDILRINAAPGHSEHHSGRAIDIGAPDEPAAEESFEATVAFAWLLEHAENFGFRMSYPRGNPHGIVYEPWHWCWHPAQG